MSSHDAVLHRSDCEVVPDITQYIAISAVAVSANKQWIAGVGGLRPLGRKE